jgi:hypothetical protein
MTPVLSMTTPDVQEFRPSLVLSLWDAYTGQNLLEGEVTLCIGPIKPLFAKSTEATFVFGTLAKGNYTMNVRSVATEPYYLPANIPVTLPLPSPANTQWPTPWPGYPNLTLADPTKTLDDPNQSVAYVAQREQASLQPSTAYPFPAGATLVRGVVTAAGVPLSNAFVTTALLAQVGSLPIVVANPSGATSAAQMLAVVSTPVIESLDPQVVLAGSPAFVLTLRGSGFDAGTVARLAGTALPTTVLSRTALTVQVPASAVSTVAQPAVVVASASGAISNQQTLTVAAAPAINTLSPSAVAAGSTGFTLTVQGSGFAANTTIQINGSTLIPVFISSSHLSVQVPATQSAAAGQLSVIATNPGPPQQISNAVNLAVVSTPVINSLEPATVIAGSPAFSLTILGSGFVSGSTVNLAGAALPTTFLDATEVSAQLTAAQVAGVGTLSITVAAPNGGVSTAQTLAVLAAPTITSLDPAQVTADSPAFTLIVNGTGFVSGSVVEVNGTALTTTFVSDTQVNAHVPRSGYTTGPDGTFVLFFDDLTGRSQTIPLMVTQSSMANAKLLNVTVLRGATVSVAIETTT